MMKEHETKYTAGDLAKKLGISARTVRFYDEKDILHPCDYSESGYRLYNDESAERLQKILMLRFLDFSIDQIREMIQEEGFDIKQSLQEQERLLVDKKERLERLIQGVQRAEGLQGARLWDEMKHIVEITREREETVRQYASEDNLSTRISIHDYSTAKVPFYTWMLQKLQLKEGMKVLEIGCGNAAFWRGIGEQLPCNLELHLTDYSTGMLNSARSVLEEIQDTYPEKKLTFFLVKKDATMFSYPIAGFDRIMANHMLYHLKKEQRIELYQQIKELLKEDGLFTGSLVGKTHNQEMHKILKEYYPQLVIPSDSFDIFLETAKQEMELYFPHVCVTEQKNDLLVPREELVLEYISSYSPEASQVLQDDRKQFLDYVHQRKNADGYFYIHKSTGMVICRK